MMGFKPSPKTPAEGDQQGTDLSASNETDSTTQPRRRKSVRMALPPSVSSTPAATPAAVEDPSRSYVVGRHPNAAPMANGGSDWKTREADPPALRDVWADDDSDAGGEYGDARKALEKATKKLAMAGKKKRVQQE